MYDDFGRTVEASGDGITQTFGYDATDVRVTVDGIDQLWDRNGGLPTLISTGVGDNYVHTAGVARDGDDWLLSDAVGSVRATVDDAGATTGSQDFTVFGEQLAGTGSFGFAGEQQDLTGQLHLRARQYNPTLGRFTSVDPVQPGAPGTPGYNLYTYSGNNPTTWTDPSGRAVLGEYAALVGDQADATEVFASGVGNCAHASFTRATAGLEGYQLGEDPGQAVLRDCRDGAIDAATTGAIFSGGGRVVGEVLETSVRVAGDIRTGSRALPAGPTPPRALGSGSVDTAAAPPRFSVDSTGTVADLDGPFGPTLDFAHGTTSASASSIAASGLDEAAAASASSGGQFAQPGSFFAFAIAPGDTEGIQLAYEMGLRHGDDVCVLVGTIPQSTYDDLARAGFVNVSPLPGVQIPEVVFSPEAFEQINRDAVWQLVKPGS